MQDRGMSKEELLADLREKIKGMHKDDIRELTSIVRRIVNLRQQEREAQ